eukprot:6510341-Alexandrium_andersonii.AAC.1
MRVRSGAAQRMRRPARQRTPGVHAHVSSHGRCCTEGRGKVRQAAHARAPPRGWCCADDQGKSARPERARTLHAALEGL